MQMMKPPRTCTQDRCAAVAAAPNAWCFMLRDRRAALHTRGALLQVLVEGPNLRMAGQAMGRSRHNKLAFFDGDGAALTGELVTVFIERVHAYSLFGRRVA